MYLIRSGSEAELIFSTVLVKYIFALPRFSHMYINYLSMPILVRFSILCLVS